MRALTGALLDPRCNVTYLDLTALDLLEPAIQILATMLQQPNCKLTVLVLWCNRYLPDAAIQTLADALPNCELISLDLTETGVRLAGVQKLAAALRHPDNKLTSLKLRDTSIGEAGVLVLAKVLKHPNCNLWSLDLSSTKAGDAGAIALAEALKHQNASRNQYNFD